ncbi:MAG: glycosyltransferase family 39 protein [Candidatus Latescibacterota bacterium]|nr:glycosyltransferase family 39 protein [Candidatus Latescibacterota bacterium]
MVEFLYMFVLLVCSAGIGRVALGRTGVCIVSRAEELVFSLGLGLGILSIILFILGQFYLYYASVFYALILIGGLVGHKELVGFAGRVQGCLGQIKLNLKSYLFWLAVLVLIGLFFNAIRSLVPAYGAVDPLAYHLALPSIYLQKHYLSFEQTLTGALYPDNIGLLYLLCIGLRDSSLAQVMHFTFSVMTVFAIWCFCRNLFVSRVGIWASVIFVFTPVIMFFSPLAYIDIGVGFFQFMALWAWIKWRDDQESSTLLLCGIFTGFAMGSKHTAIPLALCIGVANLWISYRKHRVFKGIAVDVMTYATPAILLVLPWYIRAYSEAGNPIWPVANGLFGGLDYGGGFSINVLIGVSEYGSGFGTVKLVPRLIEWGEVLVSSLWKWSWDGTLGWQRAIGIHYVALLPGICFFLRDKKIRFIAGVALFYYCLSVLVVDGNPRYNIAFFALLSILVGFVADQWGHLSSRLLATLFRLVFAVSLIGSAAQSFALAYPAFQYAQSAMNKDQFLLENEGNYEAFRYVNQNLPVDAKILLQGIVKGFYCKRDYLWDHPHQKVISYEDYSTPELLIKRMKDLGISHVVRMIRIPPSRKHAYPQYFADEFHESFRMKHLKLLHRDRSYVVFEVVYSK